MKHLYTIPTKDFTCKTIQNTIIRVNKYGIHEIYAKISNNKYIHKLNKTIPLKAYYNLNYNNKQIKKYIHNNLKIINKEYFDVKIKLLNFCYPYVDIRTDSNILMDGKCVWFSNHYEYKGHSSYPDFKINKFNFIPMVYNLGIISMKKNQHCNLIYNSNKLGYGIDFEDINNVREQLNIKKDNFLEYAPGGICNGFPSDGKENEIIFETNIPSTLLITISPEITLGKECIDLNYEPDFCYDIRCVSSYYPFLIHNVKKRNNMQKPDKHMTVYSANFEKFKKDYINKGGKYDDGFDAYNVEIYDDPDCPASCGIGINFDFL